MNTITIRLGVFGYIFSLLVTVAGGYLLWILIQFLTKIVMSQSTLTITLRDILVSICLILVLTLIGGGFIYLGLMLPKQKYIVSLEGIDIRRLRHSTFVPWKDIKAVGESPMLHLSSNYYLTPHEGKGITLYTAFMFRPLISAQAILEAAYLQEHAIEFKFVFGNSLGNPPYGIFINEATDS